MSRTNASIRSFLTDDSGSEIAEFALILTVFSMVAISGFVLAATITSASVNTQETNLTNSAVYPS
jgi:Flp pilus assembly pilin Flp